MSKKKIALLALVTILFNFATVLAVDTDTTKEYNGVTETLTLDGEFSSNGCDGAIYAHDGANLTINGTGSVHGELCKGTKCGTADCGFAMAVYANNNSTITINGGEYTNDKDPNAPTQTDLIYAARGSQIKINGGTFKCSAPQWTLNCGDRSGSQIIVTGGRFYQFDPSNTAVAPAGETEVVVPAGYEVVQDGDWYEVRKMPEVAAKKQFMDGGSHTLNEDITANGCGTNKAGAILVAKETKLEITGGNIHALLCTGENCDREVCNAAINLWAHGEGTEVTITGGTYTNDGYEGATHLDLIYASHGGKIYIKGGEFKASTPQWTLNCLDRSGSIIEVTGGRFYKFDPSNTAVAPAGETEVVVPAGYEVVQDGDWYEVVCAHIECKLHAEVPATYTETGTRAHWECNSCSKIFEDSNATIEITDKNAIIIPKLAEVVNNNATITENAFDAAIKESEEISSSTVVIPTVETEETVASVTVPVNSLNDVAEANKELSIQTSVVTVTMDTKAIQEVVNQAGNVENVKIEIIEIEEEALNESQKEAIEDKEVATILSAQILANGNAISDFGDGKVIIEIPFVLDENEKGTDYTVIYIADDGTITEIPTRYVDGFIIVELEHFSEYAIVKVATIEDGPSDDDTTDKPSDDETTDKPSDDETTDKPSDDETTDKPSDDDTTDKPSDDETTDKPSDDETTDKPSDDDTTDKPSDDDTTDKPTGDGATGEPSDDEATDEPTDGEAAEKPENKPTDIVQTGDNIAVYISILGISILGIAIVIRRKFNKK